MCFSLNVIKLLREFIKIIDVIDICGGKYDVNKLVQLSPWKLYFLIETEKYILQVESEPLYYKYIHEMGKRLFIKHSMSSIGHRHEMKHPGSCRLQASQDTSSTLLVDVLHRVFPTFV